MRVVVLTGAGISAESGVATFRDSGGLWEGHDVSAVATPEGFAADPDLVLGFYDERREALKAVNPNTAHHALVQLEEELGDSLTIVTQNVDDLHERAGSSNVIHMHGELRSAWCTGCDNRFPWKETLRERPVCPRCSEPLLRPDIVWFGEVPYHMGEIEDALRRADVFVAIGTSGEVYPAAGFVQAATAFGARTVEINLQPSQVRSQFQETRYGPATETVPVWVKDFLTSATRKRWYE